MIAFRFSAGPGHVGRLDLGLDGPGVVVYIRQHDVRVNQKTTDVQTPQGRDRSYPICPGRARHA